MKQKLLPKHFIPIAIAISMFAFIYVNVDANGVAVYQAAGKALTEQPKVAKEEDRAVSDGLKSPNLTVMARVLALAQRFIPVSN